MPLATARKWGCEKCGLANENTHQECRCCFHRKGKGRYILYPRTRDHRAMIVLEKERLVAGFFIVERGNLFGEESVTKEEWLLGLPFKLRQMIEAFERERNNASKSKDT